MRVKQPDDAQTLTRQVAEMQVKKRRKRPLRPTGKVARTPDRPSTKGKRKIKVTYANENVWTHRGGLAPRPGKPTGDDTSRGA